MAPRRRVTLIPAASSPCMQPTTRIRIALVGSPTATARIGRPSTDRPIRIEMRAAATGAARREGGAGNAARLVAPRVAVDTATNAAVTHSTIRNVAGNIPES